MSWELSFISEKDFTNHVKDTIDKYGEKLESFDIVRFNKNIVDPIKMIFDKTVYQTSWDEIVLGKETNLTIMTSDIFISVFFSI